MDGAEHSLVVAFVDHHLVEDIDAGRMLVDAWKIARDSKGRHSLLLLCFNERERDNLIGRYGDLKSNQAVVIDQLGERAIRPALVGVRFLHECRRLLATALELKGVPGFLHLFISHAKLDGLPLAQSLQHHIKTIPWLTAFYDATDLAGVVDWEGELERSASTSLLIILRTDAYEHRPWCQKEALWAEESGVPTVLVEARPGLFYPAGELPLERMPSVRIPDGNLLRVLNAALRESLRYLLFQRRVVSLRAAGLLAPTLLVRAFSYPPSMSGILKVCHEIGMSEAVIIYPDPQLRSGPFEAAEALVAKKAPNARLTTPTTLFASPPP
ncbi:toll/interleukin-1 receptor domain-containing protein [Usitatibacter rugosus]|nr:toll/interleukin-1 receptor domain-containing protein [Usitatibacter rugosus]